MTYHTIRICLTSILFSGSILCWSCNGTGAQSESADSGVSPVDSVAAMDTVAVVAVNPDVSEEVGDTLTAKEREIYPEPPFILIDKGAFTLKLYDADGCLIEKYPVGVAVNYGNKKRLGDHKTPEGVFEISMIQPSSGWTHNFGDGKGVIKGCYGPWFLRLKTPVSPHIGIHGTHEPESIGTRCTEGCIRMLNEDIAQLKEKVTRGMKVVIIPGEEDKKADNK